MWPLTLLLIPAILGILAIRTDILLFKVGVPAACSLILIARLGRTSFQNWSVLSVVAAFLFSMLGDYFLSNKGDSNTYFVLGIGAYFVAHIGYLGFALAHGKPSWAVLGILMVGYLPYYLLGLRPAIDDAILSLAVLLYLLVSCAAFAASWGIQAPAPTKIGYIVGIALILLSDTIISFTEFMGYNALNYLILPTYYLAHISITFALLLRL